jgi:hypothetical protein
MIAVIYVPDGKVPDDADLGWVADSELESETTKIVLQHEAGLDDYLDDVMVVYTAQESVVMMFRVLVAEKKLSHKDISFIYNDQVFTVNSDGRFIEDTMGFCEHLDNMLDRLLKL